MSTKYGRELLSDIYRAGGEWQTEPETYLEQLNAIQEALSNIHRHSVSYRWLCEVECGNGIQSGEWVNENWERLQARGEQLERLLNKWASNLPDCVAMELQGDPRGWVVRLNVTDHLGVVRTVGVY